MNSEGIGSTKRKRWTLEDVQQLFAQSGCELLADEYVNNKTKMKYRCSCGNVASVNLHDFLVTGARCKTCRYESMARIRRRSIDEVRSIFEKGGCTLLSDTYENTKQKLKYICSCGEPAEITLDHFLRGQRCTICAHSKTADFHRLNYSRVRKEFYKAGCVLLEGAYINATTKMKFRCTCGNVDYVSYSNFKRGRKWCTACSHKKRRGPGNPSWNPLLTDEDREKRRYDKRFIKWSREVKSRDNYTCAACFVRGVKLHSHHIESWNSTKDLRYDLDNGVTLCAECHTDFHNQFGRGHNTREQFECWIQSRNKEGVGSYRKSG